MGSGILLEYKGKRFLVTAAHVIDLLKGQKVYIYIGSEFYEVNGLQALTSNMDLMISREDDPLDIGVIQMPKRLELQTANYRFVTQDLYIKGLSINSGFYQALGYPYKRNSHLANRTAKVPGEFRSEGLRYTMVDITNTVLPDRIYSPVHHIATSHPGLGRKQGECDRINLPDLHGISGGLLQKVTEYNMLTDEFSGAYPSGVILGSNKRGDAVISIRLSLVFECLEIWRNEW
ncbi:MULTISPECIES: hypothetical protein [Chitinibacter]|uniref:hypothetical protein n=1 Tax=Chitinibacter TaxID=230666 RepID=UPI0012E08AB6|nr:MULTISPECIES: hypothetical protein [Chitinibacter]